MFRITVYCDDKKLSELLRSVSGLVVGNPEVLPVINVEAKAGKLTAKSNGDYRQLFATHCKLNKITEFSPAEGRQITKAIGMSPASFNYLCKKLREAGVVKAQGKSSARRYTVVV